MAMDQGCEVAIEIQEPSAIDVEDTAASFAFIVDRLWIPLDRDPRGPVGKNKPCPGKAAFGPLPCTRKLSRCIQTCPTSCHHILADLDITHELPSTGNGLSSQTAAIIK